MNIIDDIFSRFKWYRKFIGGKWYNNRYKIHYGLSCYTVWERNRFPYEDIYTFEMEDYTDMMEKK